MRSAAALRRQEIVESVDLLIEDREFALTANTAIHRRLARQNDPIKRLRIGAACLLDVGGVGGPGERCHRLHPGRGDFGNGGAACSGGNGVTADQRESYKGNCSGHGRSSVWLQPSSSFVRSKARIALLQFERACAIWAEVAALTSAGIERADVLRQLQPAFDNYVQADAGDNP